MGTRTHATVTVLDQLHIAGLVLGALESGRMAMNARDYQAIAATASSELERLRTDDLYGLSTLLPPALLSLVENVFFEREASAVAQTRDDCGTDRSWPAVLTRLRAP